MKKVQTSLISDTGFVVSVTVPLPSFNRGRAEAALAQAAFERTQANHSALEQQIAAEVKGAYDVTLLRRRLAQEYQQGVGEKVVELTGIARAAYEEGEQRILEVLDAYRVTLASQLRALELVAEAKQAEIELDRAVGKEVSLE
jgi:cobalt-zinc-cadmium efflux system outer membrane protein